MIQTILKLFLGGLFDGLAKVIADWRRDNKLEELGYAKEQRDLAIGNARNLAEADRIRDAIRRSGHADDWLRGDLPDSSAKSLPVEQSGSGVSKDPPSGSV